MKKEKIAELNRIELAQYVIKYFDLPELTADGIFYLQTFFRWKRKPVDES